VSASDGWVCVASSWLVRPVASETKIAKPQRAPELEGRGDQRRGESSLVGRHTPVGGILNATSTKPTPAP